MKKLGLALLAAVTISAPAFAADMAARPVKAPLAPPPPVATWTGCYIGAGGGGAFTTNDHYTETSNSGLPGGPFTAISNSSTAGARGWFGTVQAGCDYQFGNFVVGAFGDYDFMDVKGDNTVVFTYTGTQKQDWQWSVGGRVGYVVFPQLLTYVSGGFTQSHWKSTNMTNFGATTPTYILNATTRDGWFIGTGDEYAMSFLPGLFWKTEYRYSMFDRTDTALGVYPSNVYSGLSENQKFREHSVRSELVYRFNWSGR